jgi:hypothetical protein
MGRVPGNELPGYDHLVPPGQNLVVRLKLALMGFSPGLRVQIRRALKEAPDWELSVRPV